MARMAARMLARGIMGRHDERFAAGLRSCERIIVDDVSEYLYAGSDQEHWLWARDFPNLAPPFPVFWMEAIAPKVVRSGAELLVVPGNMRTVGTLVQGHRRPHGATSRAFVTAVAVSLGFAEATSPRDVSHLLASEVEWAVCFGLFVEDLNRRIGSILVRIFFLDETGALIDATNARGNWESIWTKAGPPIGSLPGPRRGTVEEVTGPATLLLPFGLAISLMHCKNVELVAQPQAPKLARAYRRRHKEPLLTYHVLDIEPMKQVLRDEGDAERSGLRHALHICRGHFKDYRERGLFGKHKGLFWWDSHVRGSGEVGTAIKDYRVRSGDS